MATKKQRRRREKLQRHEYEYVVDTDEGEEEVVESPRAAAKASTSKEPPKVIDRRGRVVSPPSWGRVLKRGAIFGPILAAFIFITGGSLSTAAKILNVIILLAIFIPFSYLVDMFLYRTMLKRQRQQSGR
jgi:hypothetical protein